MILASGSSPIVPPIIENINYHEDVPTQMRGLKRILLAKNYTDSLKLAKLFKPKRVCIIGAGLIGMELAWAFSDIGSVVTVVDHGERMLGRYFDHEYTTVLTDECSNLSIEMINKARVVKMSETLTDVMMVAE